MNNSNYIFLLGGNDLEMLEIKSILEANKISFHDQGLKWDNAQWNSYSNYFELPEYTNKIFVGIELSGKENRPHNSIDIDHHNENHENQSAIEQVITLLDFPHEWNRKRQLIAANDQGYIPAMKVLKATDEEISEIRFADRKAQGATELDEKNAQISIDNRLLKLDGVTLVSSLTDRFSTIADRLYGKADQLLIFNADTLTFYGNIQALTDVYKNDIESSRVYYGGSLKQGYFGLAKGYWTKDELHQEIPKIVALINSAIEKKNEDHKSNLSQFVITEFNDWVRRLDKIDSKKESSSEEKMHSYHIFLFPFKWKRNEDTGPYRLTDFDDLLNGQNNETGNWKKNDFHCSPVFQSENDNFQSGFDRFNEYNYFYDHVRKMLYDSDERLTTETNAEQKFMHHYEYELRDKKAAYQILLREKEGVDAQQLDDLRATYSLEIDTIILNVYKTGTAVLSFHLRNHLHADPEDILKINLFGRRISLPFFGMTSDSVYTGLPDQSSKTKLFDPLKRPKENEIPNAIWLGPARINLKSGQISDDLLYDDFSAFREPENYKNSTFLLPHFIKGLFPIGFLATKNQIGKINIAPILDDRMHVVSWYGNSNLMNSLNKTKLDKPKDNQREKGNLKQLAKWELDQSYTYEVSDWWYKYLYVDTGVLQTNRFQRTSAIREQTYSRFVEWGTLYGVSRYSFVMITSNFSETPEYLVRHLQGMYYKMVELCLLQRATILKFSDDAARLSQAVFELSSGKKKKKEIEEITHDINQLYRRYIFFVNRIYFREVTPQEQGIELYDLLQKTMRIPNEVKSLDAEICELNAFVKTVNDENQTKEAKNFTWMAAMFLGPTFFAGVLGMNTVPISWANQGTWHSFGMSLVYVVSLGCIAAIALLYIFRKQNRLKNNL